MGSSVDAAQESHKHTCPEVARLRTQLQRCGEESAREVEWLRFTLDAANSEVRRLFTEVERLRALVGPDETAFREVRDGLNHLAKEHTECLKERTRLQARAFDLEMAIGHCSRSEKCPVQPALRST